MKRVSFLCIALILLLTATLLSSCGGDPSTSKDAGTTAPTGTSSPNDTTKPTVTVTTPAEGESLYPVRISFEDTAARQPYPTVNGGSYGDSSVTVSPDPLVNYRWDSVSADDDLQVFNAYPVKYTADSDNFTGLESILTDNVNVTVKGSGTLMLDFGVEFAAWLEIESPDFSTSAASLKLSVSEYTQPGIVNSGPRSPEKTAIPQKVGNNTYRLNLNDELYEGVRFGFLHIENFKKEFHITKIRLVCQVKPTNYNGSFSSSNEMLDRIWYTAAYDVRANLKKDYFAAILMDRGDRHSWTGDAYTAQAAALPAFANYDFVLKNLKYTAVRPNGIESYELYWVLSLIDYYEYTGDKAGVRGLLTQATSRLDHAYSVWEKNPGLSFFGWDERLGGGFENPNIAANRFSYKVIAIECWNKFAAVLDDLGSKAAADKYRSYAKEKTSEILSNPEWYKSCTMHAFADAVNAGIVSEEIQKELFEKYFTDRVNRISYSPFNEYFILQALASMGKYDDALSSIYDLWGGQIEYGGTTFFETFRPDWAWELEENGAVPNNQAGYTSLAHPWSAGVLTFLSEEILGIKATAPGFSTFAVIPHLGTQLTQVSGDMPTPLGTIKASFDIKAGVHTLAVPEGAVATFAIPKAGYTLSDLKKNGTSAKADREDGDYFYFDGLTAGEYTFSGTYSGTVEGYKAPDWQYDATYKGTDTVTRGDWNGKYGADGYLLCGSGSSAGKLLPDYVKNVVFSKGIVLDQTGAANDPRALSPNIYGIGDRVTSHYATNYNNACYQTFTVDINLLKEETYTVALYFVDWQGGKSLVVEMFDGESLELVAPVKTLTDYTGGVYMIYEYNKSARFRIDHIRGDYVSLSGIFFGEGEGKAPEFSYIATDDPGAAITYSGAWKHDAIGDAYNGTFSYSKQKDAYCEYTFEGDNVTVIASRESNRGICEIFLDGVSQGKFDLYNPSILRQEKIFSKEVQNGRHTVRIVVTGEKNKNATDTYVDIDAFEHKTEYSAVSSVKLDDRDKSFVYSGNWTHDPIGDAYNGTFSYSNVRNNAVEITFSGTAIRLIASKESNRGICEIFLDGVSQGEVDLYSPSILRQQTVFAIEGLADTKHTLKVVVTGKKNASASGTYVDIDAAEITARLYTVDTVLEAVKVLPITADGKKIAFSPLPKGFTVTLSDSSEPTVISKEGKITRSDKDTEVTLTLRVSDGTSAKEKTVKVTVPSA